MKRIEITEAGGSLAQYAREAARQPLLITENGKAIAAVIKIEDADAEDISLGLNPEFIALLEKSRERQRREGGIPLAEMRRKHGLEP